MGNFNQWTHIDFGGKKRLLLKGVNVVCPQESWNDSWDNHQVEHMLMILPSVKQHAARKRVKLNWLSRLNIIQRRHLLINDWQQFFTDWLIIFLYTNLELDGDGAGEHLEDKCPEFLSKKKQAEIKMLIKIIKSFVSNIFFHIWNC